MQGKEGILKTITYYFNPVAMDLIFNDLNFMSYIEIFDEAFSFSFIIFLLSWLMQIFYYLYFYIRTAFHKEREDGSSSHSIPVSVVIAARNEAENIEKNLPLILEQDYPEYEVIVVNDCSTDESSEVLGTLMQQYPHLRVTSIDENGKFTQGKKLALTVGIKSAKNEWIVFTDADCKPASNLWLKRMKQQFTDEHSIVLGYGGYEPKSTILNNLIRFDTFFIALQYFGFAKAGIPYMGVGRNLAYKKSLFFQQKGFASHLKLISGDDDLFINQAATKNNTGLTIHKESKTISIPKFRWITWIKQKKRHLTTGKYYKFFPKFLIGLENLTRITFYFSLFYLLYSPAYQSVSTFLILLAISRLIIQWLIFIPAMRKLEEKYLLLLSIFWDIMIPFINGYCIMSNKFSTQKSF